MLLQRNRYIQDLEASVQQQSRKWLWKELHCPNKNQILATIYFRAVISWCVLICFWFNTAEKQMLCAAISSIFLNCLMRNNGKQVGMDNPTLQWKNKIKWRFDATTANLVFRVHVRTAKYGAHSRLICIDNMHIAFEFRLYILYLVLLQHQLFKAGVVLVLVLFSIQRMITWYCTMWCTLKWTRSHKLLVAYSKTLRNTNNG